MQKFKVADGGAANGEAVDRVGATPGTKYFAKVWNDNLFNLFNLVENAGYSLIDDDLEQLTKAVKGPYVGTFTYNTSAAVGQTVDDVVLGSDGKFYECQTDATSGDDPVGSVTGNWAQVAFDKGATDGILTGYKNQIINGDFKISQRGVYTSLTPIVNGAYFLDRFKMGVSVVTADIQHLINQNVGGKYTNAVRIEATSNATGLLNLIQEIEGDDLFRGQEVTFSAWVRTNISDIRFRCNIDGVPKLDTNSAISDGTWHKYTFTATGGTKATIQTVSLAARDELDANIPLVIGDYYEVALFQVENGATATNFEQRHIGLELELCKRYYLKINSSNAGYYFYMGYASTASTGSFPISLGNMRVAPTFTSSVASSWSLLSGNTGVKVGTSITANNVDNQTARVNLTVSEALVEVDTATLRSNLAGSFLAFDAEL